MRGSVSTVNRSKKHYKMKNAYIVEKLNLTADEQAAIGISAMPTGAKSAAKSGAG